jgi:sirohydrochlorin cobaltochelatase
VILVVSFGTSYNDNRDLSIGAVEEAIQAAYPDWEVRRAFTAQTVIDILDERDAIDTDNVVEAMDKLVADGVKKVVIQPTHVMNGAEYDDVMAEIAPYADQFEGFAVGAPLLTSVEDYEAVTEALLAENEYAGSEDTAIVYMGHGTHHFANATYSQAQLVMQAAGYENVFVGTVEGFPALENVMPMSLPTVLKRLYSIPSWWLQVIMPPMIWLVMRMIPGRLLLPTQASKWSACWKASARMQVFRQST